MRQRTTGHARENDEGRPRGGMKVCENWRETEFFFRGTSTANNVRPIFPPTTLSDIHAAHLLTESIVVRR